MSFLSNERFNPKSGIRVPGRVGAGAVWSGVGTLASPLVEEPFSLRFLLEPELALGLAKRSMTVCDCLVRMKAAFVKRS